MQLYTSIYECRDPASALREAIGVIEGRDKQVDNLLKGMEEINGELEQLTSERDGLRMELEKVKNDNGDGEKDVLGSGGELSLAEREELIKLRGEVAEYEGENYWCYVIIMSIIV